MADTQPVRLLRAGFDEDDDFPAALRWAHRPKQLPRIAGGRLEVQVPGSTDYWARTHYGFRVHNGPFLHVTDVKGDFIMATQVTTHPQQRFDQAGLMVQLSPSCWLKTSVEHGQPASQLGVVVTNAGFSDWSTCDFPNTIHTVALRVRRQGSDYTVEACVPHDALPQGFDADACPIKVGTGAPDSPVGEWSQLRVCHLLEDVAPAAVGRGDASNVAFEQHLPLCGVDAGLYAASPNPGEGFLAEFRFLHILAGRLAGEE